MSHVPSTRHRYIHVKSMESWDEDADVHEGEEEGGWRDITTGSKRTITAEEDSGSVRKITSNRWTR
jgi:hypothetical protein